MQVVLWGAGANLEYVAGQILEINSIVAVVDSDNTKIGIVSKIGKIIISPHDLNDIDYDVIVITAQNHSEILLKCEEYGIQKDRIISYWDDKYARGILTNRMVLTKEVYAENVKLKYRLAHMPYELGVLGKRINIKSSEELIENIILSRKSLVRFGDGEFECIMLRKRPWFQDPNEILSERLEEILNSRDERILYSIADNYGSLEKYTEESADAIRKYNIDSNIRDYVEKIETELYDAYVSRPYLIYKDKSHAKRIFELLDELFYMRDILVVEGKDGRTGINNSLFSRAKSIRRIVCPGKNAFDEYSRIFDSVVKNATKDDLIFISLGPTATVLAYDLARNGFQALDLGQLDNEYDWWKMGAKKREMIPGKMVAELAKNGEIISCEEYDKQIIDSIL